MLERQIAVLESLARPPERHSGSDIVVSVTRQLIEDILDAATPWRGEVAGRFVVEVESATVELETGLALVRLAGRARSMEGNRGGEARLELHAGVDSVEVDPTSRSLHAGISLIAFAVQGVAEAGVPAPVTDSLVESLGSLSLEAYAALLSGIAIPVALEDRVELPAIGPHPVGVPALDVPASVAVTGAWAFRDRLWVALDAGTGGGRTAEGGS